MKKYQSIPVFVEAEQFLPVEGGALPFGIFRVGSEGNWTYFLGQTRDRIEPGNWIVRTEEGEVHLFTPEGFSQTFQSVEEEETTYLIDPLRGV